MTRIIGGVAGSLKLASPAKTTRPTSDRVRESIFSRLDSQGTLPGARVLDIYAGTGALALESLSRGATFASMIEKNRQAAAVCEQNAKKVAKALEAEEISGEWHVRVAEAKHFLKSLAGSKFEELEGPINIVFVDPPYEVTGEAVAEELAELLQYLAKDFTVIVERSSRSADITWPAGYQVELRKDYGDTSVFWLERA
ncbi:MAG: hypothetical protein RL556_219 [Actinomycetota bacterium]|jgi:16S rRNA (guanine966-N2)-methyltransferase